MGSEIPNCEPTELVAGDSFRWNKSLADYPPSGGWQLSYHLRGESDLDIAWDAQVTADGDVFQVRVPPADTTNLPAGPYTLVGRVTDGTDAHTVYRDTAFQVLPNPATAVAAKSFNRQMLEALQAAALEAAPDATVVSYSINGRSETMARSDLDAEIARYELLVELERNPDARIQHAAHFVHA